MNRIFVVRVGADTAYYPLRSPLFKDGSFEYMPIWEGEIWEHPPIVYKPPMQRYCEIECFNNPSDRLSKFVPKSWAQVPAHNDPEFMMRTYGDVCQRSSRARNLINDPQKRREGVEPGDYLFFLARLEQYDGNRFVGFGDLYFIGYFHVESICGPIERPLQPADETEIGRNAHVLRVKADVSLWSDERYKFWVFRGGTDSVRFRRALKAEWQWLSQIFSDVHGQPWSEKKGQTLLQRVTSYTRTVRCQLDPSVPQQRDAYGCFWEKIQQHLLVSQRG